jgi:glutamate/tyrosine decarboxylase-like PLP-dependent enzyme
VVVGTAGTTSAGAVDPLPSLADAAAGAGCWFHVDAAWGGAALLSRRLAPLLRGIERADSVTWDAHKGLFVPMGAGMFFCRHPRAVARAFSVRKSYAPGSSEESRDPYLTTAQWSRRFIGLPVFVALATLGAKGYAELVERQVRRGEQLRDMLRGTGWTILNSSPLPIVCFTHPRLEAGETSAHAVAKRVVDSGEAWISAVRLGEPPVDALRACITSFETSEEDLRALLAALEKAVARRDGG